MAAPVISSTTSYLGFKRNEAFQFFPSATNSPLSWTLDKAVTGLAIDTPTIFAATGAESTDLVTATGHDFATGDRVFFRSISGGSGLAVNTIYWVRDIAGSDFKLAASQAGAAIDFTTAITAAQIQKVSTGRIYSTNGIALQGPIVLLVSATNGDGTGTREFCIGIGAGGSTSAGSADTGIDLVTDVVTRITRLGLPGVAGGGSEAEAAALAYIKYNDTVMFVHRFEKYGVQIDPELTGLKMAFKAFEPEKILATSLAFEKTGTGVTAAWNLPVTITGSTLKGALADREKPTGTFITALAEIEWQRTVSHNSNPLTLIGTSRTFKVQIDRDLAAN